jgi:hypothetical protein
LELKKQERFEEMQSLLNAKKVDMEEINEREKSKESKK